MKKLFFLLLMVLFFSTILQAQVAKTINVTAGNLYTSLTDEERNAITSLTITGTIDARDFKTMRDNMPLLAEINLSAVAIAGYSGTEGTLNPQIATYPANTLPNFSFFNPFTNVAKVSLTTINFPVSLISIGGSAFSHCTGLTSVAIPSTVISIDTQAFSYCSNLTSINIPALLSYGYYVFRDCSKLNSLYFDSPVPLNLIPWPDFIYTVNRNTVILKVPLGSKAAYQNAYLWNEFSNIEEVPGLFISASTIGMGSNSGTDNITINCSSNWTAVSDQEWLTMSASSGVKGLSSLTLTTKSNPDPATRTATITVSATGSISKTLTITQYGKVETTAGNLYNRLGEQLATITSLTLTGTIDARDFKTMRDKMPLLAYIDLSEATIVEYKGIAGTIPGDNVTYPANTIPDYSFHDDDYNLGKYSLVSIILPSNTISIGTAAFKKCRNLTSVTIPSTTKTINNSAFMLCSYLSSINIPSSVTSIGMEAFHGCMSLTSINLPPTLTTIEEKTFTSCISLTSITIPPSVKTIGMDAFWNCTSLTSITIPPSVEIIKSAAFFYCPSLTSIKIPTSVTSIGSIAFGNCNINNIYADSPIPIKLGIYDEDFSTVNKTTAILHVPFGSKAAYQTANIWKSFTNIVEMPGLFLSENEFEMGASAETAKLSISSSTNWFAVSDQDWLTLSPGSGATGTQILTLSAIPNPNTASRTATVTVSATGLKSEIIKVTQYGKFEVTPGNLKTLLSNQLATIPILTLTGSIDARDFKTMRDDMPLLTKVDLSGTTIVEYKGNEGTYDAYDYTYPANKIPNKAFYLPDYDWGRKIKLTDILLPSAITSIGYMAFENCGALTSINLPSSLISIGTNAFNNCRALTSVYIPSSVTTIGSLAFGYCMGLTSINIPSSVTTIGSEAFLSCMGLTSISIPSSVISIAGSAFWNCKNVSSIYAYSFSPIDLSSSSMVFMYIDKSTTVLYVPPGSKAAYQAANQWQDFTTIVEMSGLFLSTKSINLGAKYETGNLSLRSSSEWTVVSDQKWLTLTPESGIAGASSLTLTPTANVDSISRTATITITAKGFEPQRITVNQYGKINNTAGKLKDRLAGQLSTITSLTLTGTIDARDFKTMRDLMPLLTKVDLSQATIIPYNGSEGTFNWGEVSYPANEIPKYAFSVNENKSIITSIILPESLISIGHLAFSGCTRLTNISMNTNITTINPSAFYNCSSLTSIVIPSSVVSIGENCFSSCYKLNAITVLRSIPPDLSLSYNVFSDINKSTCILNVPFKSAADYRNANQWKDFKNIIEDTNGFHVSSNSVKLAGVAGDKTSVQIYGNVEWKASSDQNWLLVNPINGNDSLSITFTAEENPSFLNVRTAYVTISSSGVYSQTITVVQSRKPQPPKTIDNKAGNIAFVLTEEELATITDLTITGTLDARDFKIMRDKMPFLAKINLSAATIVAYSGNEGTRSYGGPYAANTIPEAAFFNKASLISIEFPRSIATFEKEAFSQCVGLSDIIIPEGVTKIDRNVFYYCTGLKTVVLPSSVIFIGAQCFRECSNLTSLSVKSSIPPVLLYSYDVFYRIDKSKCVLNVPFASKLNYRNANQWSDFWNVVEPANGFCISSNKVTVAGTADSKASVLITANIEWNASTDQDWLTIEPSSGKEDLKVIFTAQANPSFIDTRTAIITVSSSVPGVVSQTVILTQSIHPQPPKTLKLMPGGLLMALTTDELATITDLTITGTMDARDFKTIRDRMPLLTKINLNKAIIVAYQGPDGTSMTGNTDYPANTIPECALGSKGYTGRNLTSIILPESITAIGPYAFSQCQYLTNVIIPPLVKTIGDSAFFNCVSLSNISIPAAVTTIGIQALGMLNCTIEVDADNPNYMSSNNVLFNKTQNKLIQCVNSNRSGNYEIPATVITIDDYAFYNCKFLTSIIIPSSVATIGKYAFYNCFKITTINIPSSVTFIGESAFSYCYGLKSVYVHSMIPVNLDASPYVFTNNYSVLYVPYGSKAAYKTAIQWKDFGNIVENNSDLIASAGPDIQTEEGKTVILEGSVLTNTSGKPLTYQWTAPEGVTLSSTTELRPTFTAPDAPYDLTYIFSLIVSDGTIQSLADEILVFVRNVNKVPVADAGPDQTVNEGTLVTLDGSASHDPDNTTLRYEWTAPAGILLSATNTSQPYFTAPQVAKDTVFTFSLLVSDSNNYTTDKVSITVKNINKAPTANAGADQTVNEGTLVSLDGSSSVDPENDALSYRWTAPKGILLSSETESKPSFTAPKVDSDSIFIFSLIVSDGSSSSLADEVAVTVKNINQAPVAVAGDALYSAEGVIVTLNGTLSSDPDGDALTYLWTAPAGITLSSQAAAMPTFTAPDVQSDTWLTFTLVVSDGKLNSSPSEVKVLIQQIDPILGLISKAKFLTQPVPVNYRLFKKVVNSFVQQIDTLSATGDSVFIHLEPGQWMVLVSSESDPAAFVSTYAGDVSNWNEAEIITVPDRTTVVKVINCIMPPAVKTGIGQIAGYIYEKPGEGTKSISILREENLATNNPVKTALVQLYKKGETVPVASVLTDDQGYYQFDQLEIAGYEIQVEIPGYVQSERFPVSLSSTAPATKIWFAVNTSLQVITDNNTVQQSFMKAFPNPTHGMVTISGLTGRSKIAVYAMNGKLVLQKETVLAEETVDLTSQVTGTYILVINDQRFKIYKK